MEHLPAQVNKWSSRDVRVWLKGKGCDYSVQNKFFSERIDGEALLLLNTKDIHKLLSDYPFGYKVKISAYIDRLKPNPPDNNKSSQQANRHAKRKTCDILSNSELLEDHESNSVINPIKKHKKMTCVAITNPSILPCTNNNTSSVTNTESLTDDNSDSQNTEKRNKDQNKTLNNTNSTIENETHENEKKEKSKKEKSKKENKRYTNDHKHNISNHGKRWIGNDLKLMWGLHQKGYSNMKIAEHFKRTECGIMVQIDKKYKALRAHERLKEIVENRRKQIGRSHKKDTESYCSLSESESDDDELVINNIRRNTQLKQRKDNQ